MYIPESKPKLSVNNVEVDNLSPDGNVFFIEEGHKYFYKNDINDDGTIREFNDSTYKFKSPTGILGNFYEHFDAVTISEKYVIKHGLDITAEELRAQWDEKARVASERGSLLHSLGESIVDGWDFGELPDLPQVQHLIKALEEVANENWVKAKVELLVYNTAFKIAGQADIVLKRSNGDETEYGIFDYKFLKEPVQKKSFFNPRTRKYKKMYGPFRHLPDSNFYHYSIQLEFYRMLMGRLGKKVTTKKLIVVTEEQYDIVDCHPINIWVDTEGNLQAKYKMFNGKIFNSSNDREYMSDPFKII